MKILIVGSGAREHVIAETLKRSSYKPEIYTYGSSKNPGLVALSSAYEVGNLKDFDKLKNFALKVKPDFAFIGPEAPIADGITDMLEEIGIKSVAPCKILGALESSKSFARDILKKYGIPGNPQFNVFFNEDGLRDFIEKNLGGNYVVKADGLKGGKGVKVSGDHLQTVDDGVAYALECLKSDGKVVIEEKFIGEEFSLMAFVDGKTVVSMPPVQDHKRAYDGDKGPNTGGMGSYGCEDQLLPFLRESDVVEAHKINVAVTEALYKETGKYFKGIMYGGFIAVRDGVRLIEYNVRFGDPEAMNVLPILKTDFVDICLAIINGGLDKLNVEFEKKATVCKYLVPDGYPDNPCKDKKIEVGVIPPEVKTYYASVDQREDGLYLSGSRAIAFVGIADNLDQASAIATSALDMVKGPVFYRKDIGTKDLIQKRIDHMKEVRS
ncbi:MAG: phosphoribosylamine--glycine ligase [Candidatus Gracilibacteria bacterium]|jgi:phosphoribosylamine--glycine ligase